MSEDPRLDIIEAKIDAMHDALTVLFQGIKDREERLVAASQLYDMASGSLELADRGPFEEPYSYNKVLTLERYMTALGYVIDMDPISKA
ncbi:hypothetical protein [cf. Phormidesmis sp. LEGE 11477]|uniref:hypothetical protein n=1 Tax=cf. Phormidesmis sp. LEGE 11477 TaxID=1828680 RepID=UPI0018810826|nr:hypothetical protein [cf. Phormidesmis sp. LEGE 11477]MBE9064960.1 hypothetical protein [cf. Phormidesmis sp. LEGE 11477]